MSLGFLWLFHPVAMCLSRVHSNCNRVNFTHKIFTMLLLPLIRHSRFSFGIAVEIPWIHFCKVLVFFPENSILKKQL